LFRFWTNYSFVFTTKNTRHNIASILIPCGPPNYNSQFLVNHICLFFRLKYCLIYLRRSPSVQTVSSTITNGPACCPHVHERRATLTVDSLIREAKRKTQNPQQRVRARNVEMEKRETRLSKTAHYSDRTMAICFTDLL